MKTAAVALFAIWFMGFGTVFVLHRVSLQMVTPGLALLRAAVWPYYLATGRPHGVPLPMD